MLCGEKLQKLDHVLNAKGIAVVGAAEAPGKVGYNIIESLLWAGYPGKIYPVNPRLTRVLGMKVYRSLGDLPEPVELVVIAINPYATVKVLSHCAAAGAKGVVCIATGFRELGPEGEKLERELVAKAEQYGLLLIGPNTLGFINPWAKINITFYPMRLKAGSVALVSQSGGMGLALIYRAFDEGVGLSKWIGCGNRSSLQFSDYLEYLAYDPYTKVIGLFMEGTEDARRLVELAKTILRGKPLVVYKAGRNKEVDFAALTHTGSMVGSYRVYRDLFEQAGILVVESMEDLIAACKALACCPIPARDGVGILTHTAGPSIVAMDELTQKNLPVPPWQEQIIETINKLLEERPPTRIKNPLDVPGVGFDPSTYGKLAEVLLRDPNIGSLLAIFTHNRNWRFPSAELIELRCRQPKPIVALYISPAEAVKDEVGWLQSHGIPLYTDPRSAATGLAALHRYSKVMQSGIEVEDEKPDFSGLHVYWQRAQADGREVLTESETKALLAAAGMEVTALREAGSEEEAVLAALELGFPVALKVLSPKISHKSDIGGVRLNLASQDEVRGAYREIMQQALPLDPDARVTVQEMASPGLEIIVGVAADPHFGRVLMVGLGGVFTDVLEDVAYCLPPISRSEALAMLKRLKGWKILSGYRGSPPLDIEALVDLL